MSLTKEQLMAPRYKVIALWPFTCNYKIGYIIHESENLEGATFFKTEVHKYPHLFKPLQWWEERLPEEMPEYVKVDPVKRDDFIGRTRDNIFKVYRWNGAYSVISNTNQYESLDNRDFDFIPATEQEYLTFKQQSK